MLSCIVKDLVYEISPGSKQGFSLPYISVGNYLSNLRSWLCQLEDLDGIVGKPIAFPFGDHIRIQKYGSLDEPEELSRKWTDENWEWKVILNNPCDHNYSCVPFRQRERVTHTDCGALRSHFDYTTFRRCLTFRYRKPTRLCNFHETRLWWIVSEWLMDLHSFSISRSDYARGTDIHDLLGIWDSLSFNHARSGKRKYSRCTFCRMEEREAKAKWKKDIEERLAILKLPGPSACSLIGSSADDTAPIFTPLPVNCGHGVPFPYFDHSDEEDGDECDGNDHDDEEEERRKEEEEKKRREDVIRIRRLPCFADVLENIGLSDSFWSSHAGSGTRFPSTHQSAGAAGVVDSKDTSPECVHCRKNGHRRGTPSSLDSAVIERGSILGNFQSLEEALNTIYTSTLQDNYCLSTTATEPRPLDVALETNLLVAMNDLHIQRRGRGRRLRVALLEDLLNPIARGGYKSSPYKHSTTVCVSASPVAEEMVNSDGCQIGHQNIQILLSDSSVKVRPRLSFCVLKFVIDRS